MSVFVSWIRFHGRSAELADKLGAEPVFLESRWPRLPAPLRYVELAVRTAVVLRSKRWQTIVLMLPPLPLLLVAKLFAPRSAKLVADMHTGVFSDPKWKWAMRPTLRLLRGDTAVVTNPELVEVCERHGVRALDLHDIVTPRPGSVTEMRDATVLCPLGYASDEPISALLEAARGLPNVTFLLTGRAPDTVRAAAPANVRFTGYLSNADYDDTVRRAAVVVALTTRDHTMQRAGYEALMWGVPVVTSDFDLLRAYFGEAAVYSDCTTDGIRDAITRALADNHAMRVASRMMLRVRMSDQDRQVDALRTLIDESPVAS